MAEESNQSGSNLSGFFVPTLLAVLALAGGFTWSLTPLNSRRPAVEARRPNDIRRVQSIEARLWQDPIAAVEQAQKEALLPGAAPGNKALTSADMRTVLKSDHENSPRDPDQVPGLHVLLVMTPSGPYAEEAEFRLRSREAVLAALSAAQYRAEDEERIGAWGVWWPQNVPRNVSGAAPAAIKLPESPEQYFNQVLFPFERFRIRRNTQRIRDRQDHAFVSQDRAIVIWLPDALFDGAPLERLAMLAEAVRSLHKEAQGKLTIDILGPLGSTMLRDMLPDQAEEPGYKWPPGQKPLHDVNMFSWSATAMDELLVNTWQSDTVRSETKKYLDGRWGLNFTNTITTDDVLNKELADELLAREVNVADPEQHVLLLYEWDTFYARTLPVSFAAEVRRRQTYGDRVWAIGSKLAIKDILHEGHRDGRVAEVVPNVHAFTYLRGIDGKMSSEQGQKKDAEPSRGNPVNAAKDQTADTRAEMNRAEGANQIDYMPRLALEVQRMRTDLEDGKVNENLAGVRKGQPPEKGKLKAIGLMGSDFYDKLLILQALRPHFPDVIFFTTDLDGRFVDRDVSRWTQNLVVASGFGLTLRPEFQRDAAPFRSSYQTSLYLASLEALHVVPSVLWGDTPKPRRFEIGRTHAVDLSVDDGPAGGVQPPLGRTFRMEPILSGLLLVGIAVGLLITFIPPLRRTFRKYERQYERQSSVFFTEKDILNPEGIIHAAFPWQVPSPPSMGASPLVMATAESPRGLTRVAVMQWLNAILRSQHGETSTLSADERRKFLGTSASGHRLHSRLIRSFGLRRLTQLREKTERLVSRRLLLERCLGGDVGSCEHRCVLTNKNLESAPRGLLAITVVVLLFLGLLLASHLYSGGEPFSMTEGISVWPCEAIRMLALILTVIFIIKGQMDIRLREVILAENFFLRRKNRLSSFCTGIAWMHRCAWRSPRPWLASVLAWPIYLWSLPDRYPSMAWFGAPGPVNAQKLWDQYRDRSRVLPRLARSGMHLLVYLAFCILIYMLSREDLFVPARGTVAFVVDHALLLLVVPLFLLLNFLVADAVRLARSFIRVLVRGDTEWPAWTLDAERERIGAWSTGDVIEWLDIQFIGHLTKSISGLVFYPAIVLCLLIVARTRYFDNWHWPWFLVVVFGLNACWPLVSAFLLQTAATEARKDALEKLNVKLVAAKMLSEEKHAKAIETLIERVKNYREGAFTNYLDNPALKALLVPFTGAGVMNVVNILTAS